MQKLITFKITLFFIAGLTLISSCKNLKKSTAKKKGPKSEVTGWNYGDKSRGGFNLAKGKDQPTGPGLVFVPGGTFTMGQNDEDVMNDWNNIRRRVSVPSFYMDKTEVANMHYREYMFWLGRVFDPAADPNFQKVLDAALPDTLVWRSELSYNEPLVEYYFRHPGFNDYPVVGVTWKQAHDFCVWRSDRVNEGRLVDKNFLDAKGLISQTPDQNFTTKSYLLKLYQGVPGKYAKSSSSKGKGKNSSSTAKMPPSIESGDLLPDYRLPTEAEWEYAAYGLIEQNPHASGKEGKRGEELIQNKQLYPWSQNLTGLRDTRHGTWQGQFLANFKRGAGDVAGVAGGLNDRAFQTAPVVSYYPNGFGLYNMAGNVSEWVEDVYRPLSNLDVDDVSPFRGNKFKTLYKNANGEAELDSTGHVKMRDVTDAESRNRRNYQKGNVINYLDGDTISQVNYGYGVSSLINDNSRVIKGGSWDDRAYWLSPGTRRFLDEDKALKTLGFRCAMTRMGSPEGNGTKTGNRFPIRRQNSRASKKK